MARSARLWRRMPAASALALIGGLLAGSAQAQSGGPVILSCTWNGGAVEFFRYQDGVISDWRADSWSWRPRPCVKYDGEPARCQTNLNDATLYFQMTGQSIVGDESDIFSQHTEESGLVFSRQDGSARYYYNHYGRSRLNRGGPIRGKTYDEVELFGTCAKADDPASKPKPPPPPKAF